MRDTDAAGDSWTEGQGGQLWRFKCGCVTKVQLCHGEAVPFGADCDFQVCGWPRSRPRRSRSLDGWPTAPTAPRCRSARIWKEVNFMKIEGSRTTFASDEGEEFEMDTSKVLGVGAQGKVHPGKNTKTGQEVAVKSMPVKHLILDEAGAAKIKLIDDEIEIGKAIGTHPNIAGLIAGCDLYREGTSDHPHFKNIVMELVQ
ncbi:unnamed protein product, partial [Polarella glacialis]